MICIHEVIYSVCSRNFCGILSASEDFMTHDEMMSLLANTLADAAGHAGCLPILDCFSPHPGEEVTVSIPMCDDTVDIVLEDLDFPHEWEELLENSGADTMGDLVDYLCYCSQNNISLAISPALPMTPPMPCWQTPNLWSCCAKPRTLTAWWSCTDCPSRSGNICCWPNPVRELSRWATALSHSITLNRKTPKHTNYSRPNPVKWSESYE